MVGRSKGGGCGGRRKELRARFKTKPVKREKEGHYFFWHNGANAVKEWMGLRF